MGRLGFTDGMLAELSHEPFALCEAALELAQQLTDGGGEVVSGGEFEGLGLVDGPADEGGEEEVAHAAEDALACCAPAARGAGGDKLDLSIGEREQAVAEEDDVAAAHGDGGEADQIALEEEVGFDMIERGGRDAGVGGGDEQAQRGGQIDGRAGADAQRPGAVAAGRIAEDALDTDGEIEEALGGIDRRLCAGRKTVADDRAHSPADRGDGQAGADEVGGVLPLLVAAARFGGGGEPAAGAIGADHRGAHDARCFAGGHQCAPAGDGQAPDEAIFEGDEYLHRTRLVGLGGLHGKPRLGHAAADQLFGTKGDGGRQQAPLEDWKMIRLGGAEAVGRLAERDRAVGLDIDGLDRLERHQRQDRAKGLRDERFGFGGLGAVGRLGPGRQSGVGRRRRGIEATGDIDRGAQRSDEIQAPDAIGPR